MNDHFRQLIDSLDPKLRELLDCPPVKITQLPKQLPVRGIYMFSEGPKHIYVGRSNNIRRRLYNHTRMSGTSFTATLAFRIARQSTGKLKATYKPIGSREELERDPEFEKAFDAAKFRLSRADIRFVSEPDPTRQSVLEIYIATSLETPFNDFDNH